MVDTPGRQKCFWNRKTSGFSNILRNLKKISEQIQSEMKLNFNKFSRQIRRKIQSLNSS